MQVAVASSIRDSRWPTFHTHPSGPAYLPTSVQRFPAGGSTSRRLSGASWHRFQPVVATTTLAAALFARCKGHRRLAMKRAAGASEEGAKAAKGSKVRVDVYSDVA
mmetsp:Transcript_26124/g.60916  ORF Transcript_26124/g.60916 Transcript_26124/m.60916 type:complete len:106 (-) Transcript_26124:677-994(-)